MAKMSIKCKALWNYINNFEECENEWMWDTHKRLVLFRACLMLYHVGSVRFVSFCIGHSILTQCEHESNILT